MNQKENISDQMKTLLKHISILKETRNSFNKQYKELSEGFISVKHREKTFLDKIFIKRYKKYLDNYENSKQKEIELNELNDNILQLQIEIERLEEFLYSLQKQFSDEYPEDPFRDKLTPDLEDIEID